MIQGVDSKHQGEIAIVAEVDDRLTDGQRDELAAYEAVIQKAVYSFIEAGNALRAIREDRLYRETHTTFEDYCQQRWQITRHHANRMIVGAGVAEDLEPIGSTLKNLEQTKPLGRLSPSQRRDAWTIAQEKAGSNEPTGKDLEAAALQVSPPQPKAKPQKDPKKFANKKRRMERREQKEREEFARREAELKSQWLERLAVVRPQMSMYGPGAFAGYSTSLDIEKTLAGIERLGRAHGDVCLFRGPVLVGTLIWNGNEAEIWVRDREDDE